MPKHSIANPEYRKINRRRAVNVEHIPDQTRHPDVFERSYVGALAEARSGGEEWVATSAAGWRISVVRFRENVLRVRMAPNGVFDPTPTYALPEGTTADGGLAVEESDESYTFATPAGALVLAKADGAFSTRTADGKPTLSNCGAPYVVRSIMAGTVEVGTCFESERTDAYHALGDKPGELDMRGRRYTMWNTDAFGYDHRSDELYKSIPFVLAERGDCRVGVLFDNTHRATFDFAKETIDQFQYAAEGGELTAYFFFGEDPVQICADYCRLTGTPPMPPIWALGYQQCRWSYYPESRAREVVEDFREKRIPCDAIYLDIDYMDAYKCFTWSEVLFPNLKDMIADFREVGMRTVVMIDPGISSVDPDYDVYRSGTEHDAWCRRTNGEVMRGPVWPEECVFPDYTDPEVRDWWGDLYTELYETVGVSGFWNDMNEPAVFKVDRATFPDEVLHDMDGEGGTHARAHNVYGLKMTEASLEGLRKIQPEVRPFLLTRATYAGGQRYAACWTGDNTANWRHLQTANHQCIRLSLSGFSLTGSDIGGFNEDPDGELYTRWIQLAIFHPVMRTHSMGNNADGSTQTDQEAVADAASKDRRDQEPWSYGEPFTSHAREAINWRMRLLPTLYTAMERLHRTGTPILVPSYMDDPSDARLVDRNAFRFGEHLFVDPVLKAGQEKQRTYLPKGKWYELQAGLQRKGGQRTTVTTPLDYIPCFVRGGAVLQLDPVRQHTAEAYASAPELHVYHAEGEVQSSLYLDAGEGYGFESGDYLRSSFTYRGEAGRSRLTAKREGDYTPPFTHYDLVWHGSGEGDWSLRVDGASVAARAEGDTYRAEVPVGFGELEMVRG